ncbi:MAG: 2-phosphosulfolactate phosphatase [Blastocatellia bacterium]
MTFDQSDFDVKCEWGENGVRRLAPASDVVIIVDVLSFSTCVEIANSRGAIVFPYRWKDESAAAFAASVNAELAGVRRAGSIYSLSPASLINISAGTRLALPSPNGSTLSLSTGATPTLTACLRNCHAVAMAAAKYGRRTAVIPSGERWDDGSLRPAFEDWVGAGAIISHLKGSLAPEARAAMSAYLDVKSDLRHALKQCGSGRELIERGFERDVEIASELDVSECSPTLVDGSYLNGFGQISQEAGSG